MKSKMGLSVQLQRVTTKNQQVAFCPTAATSSACQPITEQQWIKAGLLRLSTAVSLQTAACRLAWLRVE